MRMVGRVKVGSTVPSQPADMMLLCVCRSAPAAAPFEFDFEEAQLTEQNVRDLVYEEMRFYHPEM